MIEVLKTNKLAKHRLYGLEHLNLLYIFFFSIYSQISVLKCISKCNLCMVNYKFLTSAFSSKQQWEITGALGIH